MDNSNFIIDWGRLQVAKDQLHQDCPQLAAEIERGAQLVSLGTVRQTGGNAWKIHDPERQKTFTVLFTLDWSCDCGRQHGVAFRQYPARVYDWFLAGWQPVCIHIAAAALYWLACTPVEAKAMHDESASGIPVAEAMQ